MRPVKARVDNVRAGSLARTVVVDVLSRPCAAVRNPAQTPGRIVLCHEATGRDQAVLLNIVNLYTEVRSVAARKSAYKTYIGMVPKNFEGRLVKLADKTSQGVLKDLVRLRLEFLDSVVQYSKRAVLFELDNVFVRNEVAGLRCRDVQRGGLRAPMRRAGHSKGQKGHENGETHFDGLDCE